MDLRAFGELENIGYLYDWGLLGILRKQVTTKFEEQIRNSEWIAFNIPKSTKSWGREHYNFQIINSN